MRVKRFALILILYFFLGPSSTFAVSYIWPLSKNYGISSTFGEPRDDHFHAGIDISTNGETGLPVLSIADGKIVRLKIQKRGYGKALYIDHKDGTQSVYAHLERYSSELGLEKLYENKARQMGTRYVGDIYVDPPIAVRQGAVVAYSGESGAGLPHLHLEVRRNGFVALNPLISGFRDPLDSVAPTFQACYLYPLEAGSLINGDIETQEVRLKKRDKQFYGEQLPVVQGDFLTSVSVYDSAARPYRRTPHNVTYSIDGRIVYVLQFDQFSYTQSPPFGLVYDQGKPGPSFFEYPIILGKLTDDSDVPFAGNAVPVRTKDLSPGLHRLQIEASDANQNSSVATVEFIVNHPPLIRLDPLTVDAGDLVAAAAIEDSDWKTGHQDSLTGRVEYSTDGKTFQQFPGTSLDLQAPPGLLRFLYRLPLNSIDSIRSKEVVIRARSFDGVDYSPYVMERYRLDGKPELKPFLSLADGPLRYTAGRGVVRIILDAKNPLVGAPALLAGIPPVQFDMKRIEPSTFHAILQVPPRSGIFQVESSANNRLSIPVNFIERKQKAQIQGENFTLSLEQDSLLWSSFVWTKSIAAYQSKSLPMVGPFLQVGPRGLPLKKPASLQFRYPPGISHPERLSIYAWSRSQQKWQSLPSQNNVAEKTIQTRVRYFDLYALIHDNAPPTMTAIFPKRNSKTSNQTPKLAMIVRDSGMDVDDERITFYVDDQPYQAEYDPDRNLATAQIEQTLKKGYHRFRAVAYDYGGNRTESPSITFRVR